MTQTNEAASREDKVRIPAVVTWPALIQTEADKRSLLVLSEKDFRVVESRKLGLILVLLPNCPVIFGKQVT